MATEEVNRGHWGDVLGKKEDTVVRIVSHNIAGFPMNRSPKANIPKEKMIRDLVNGTEADVFVMQEINVNWEKAMAMEHMNVRCRSWFDQLQTTVSYNLHEGENPKRTLRGGTSIWVMGQTASRAGQRKNDPTDLGRWSSVKIFGEGNTSVRVFSVYCPTKNTDDVDSTHNQHLRYLLDNGTDVTPQDAWLKDLEEAIRHSNERGEKVIVGGDINNKSKSRKINALLRRCYLREIFDERFENDGPPTFLGGSDKIDVIWASYDIRVKACGYLEVSRRVGDHRVLWADIETSSILGDDIPRPNTKMARRLTLRDPRVVKEYIRILKNLVKKTNYSERLARLVDDIGNNDNEELSEMQQDCYEALLDEFLKFMTVAERKCRRLKTGGVVYSPDIGKARCAITYWWLMLRKVKGYRYNKKLLSILFDEVPNHHRHENETLDEEDVKKVLKAVKKDYYAIVDVDDARRTEYLWGLAASKADKNKTCVESEFKQLTNAEDARNMHRMIALTKPPKKSKSITAVKAPELSIPIGGDETSNVDYVDKEDVERAFIQHLIRRFTQAYHSPPFDDTFVSKFGLFGTTKEVADLLQGKCDLSDLSTPMSDLLRTLIKRRSGRTMKTNITGKDFADLWKNIKEKTTSSPLNHHFGHFKAIATHEHLSDIMGALLSIPLSSGFAPTQYKKMTACLLEKKQGDFRIEKLRIILLLDAMYSATLRILAKWVSAEAEKTGRLAMEQSGSRKQMDAKAQGINIRMTMDLAILYRRPLAVICNDLKSCYDRMVHSFVGMALQSCGIPDTGIKMKFGVAQEAIINVRTGHGISEMTNQSGVWSEELNRTYHSVFQGSPDGPIQWAIVSSAVLEAYKTKGYGFKITRAIEGSDLMIVAGLFVDDSTYFQSSENDTVEDVVRLSQESQTYLERLIACTGGAMNPAKSFWWLIDFKWANGNWEWTTMDETAGVLSVRNPQNNLEALTRLEVSTAKKLLGAEVCPNDDGEGTVNALSKKAATWAEYASKRRINTTHAWIGLKAGIMKGLEWPLATTVLNESQCKRIMEPVLVVGLRSSKVQSRISRTIAFGPERYNGLGLPQLYTTMGVAKICFLLQNTHRQNQSGEVIRATFQAMQIIVGTSTFFLNVPFNAFRKTIHRTWISNVWEFSSDKEITYDYRTPSLLRRENDRYLMDIFLQLGYRGVQLRHLQQCRIYLKALTLADIVNVNGVKIADAILNKSRSDDIPLRFEWPNQPLPSNVAWRTWKSALQELMDPRRPDWLATPLGKWKDEEKPRWIWFYCPSDNRLYQRWRDTWKAYYHVGKNGRPLSGHYVEIATTTNPPNELLRASTLLRRCGLCLTGFAHDVPTTRTTPPETDMDEWRRVLSSMPEMEQYLLENAFISKGNMVGLARGIRRKTLRAVSDGSYRPQTGRGGFQSILETKDRKHQMIIAQAIPGDLASNDPYRSESVGMWASTAAVEALTLVYRLRSGRVTVGCDGKSALERCFKPDWATLPKESHYDVLMGMEFALKRSKVQYVPRWIEGHTDDHSHFDDLPRWEQLNVLCDAGAKLMSAREYEVRQVSLEGVIFASIGHQRLVRDIQMTIADHTVGAEIKEYWVRKLDIDREDLDQVEWTALRNARQGFPPSKARWLTKFLSENCPTGINMVKWGFRDSDKCPKCGKAGETAEHVLRCPHAEVQKMWKQGTDKLNRKLTKWGTKPSLRTDLTSAIRKWSKGYFPTGRSNVMDKQLDIGWHAALGGFFHKSWAEEQQTYYEQRGSRRSGRTWLAKTIREIWHIAWSIWEARNKKLHKPNVIRNYEDMSDVDRDIRREFTRRSPSSCPAHYRHLFFNRDLPTILARSNYHRRAWITDVTNAREACLRAADAALAHQQQALRRWLGLS